MVSCNFKFLFLAIQELEFKNAAIEVINSLGGFNKNKTDSVEKEDVLITDKSPEAETGNVANTTEDFWPVKPVQVDVLSEPVQLEDLQGLPLNLLEMEDGSYHLNLLS